MEVVLADDFSGAAEVAGIAWRTGAPVELCRSFPDAFASGVTVIDTDTRLRADEEAARVVGGICGAIREHGVERVYKKIDSVMRGPLAAEVEAALSGLGRDRAVVLSANPSRGRIIRDGRYFVEGIPLHETDFAGDPIHPTTTDRVREHVEDRSFIRTPDAETLEEVRKIAASLGPNELPVGAADFYRAWRGKENVRELDPSAAGRRLWIGGSQAIRAEREAAFAGHGIPVVEWGGEPIGEWADAVLSAAGPGGSVAMEIRRGFRIPAEEALKALSEAGGRILDEMGPDMVFAEGGATASALMEERGWRRFRVTRELAPGVVGLRPADAPDAPEWVVKPGSYPWPVAIYV